MPLLRVSGSASPTVGGAAVVLTEQLVGGVYVLEVDVGSLVSVDVVAVTIYGKARAGDTAQLVHSNVYRGATNVEPLITSDPVVTPHYYRAELAQTAGTARSFPWALTQIG